jgi:hypothetical protein
MNRATILLEKPLTKQRCEEIALLICAEHFGQDNPRWTVVYRIPEDTPLYLRDQFEAEIREKKYKTPVFLVVYGPTPAKDGDVYVI